MFETEKFKYKWSEEENVEESIKLAWLLNLNLIINRRFVRIHFED